jgi:hypothetical protein
MVPADADSTAGQPVVENVARGDISHTTPLPKVQLAILIALFLAEPITSTVIYPFANEVYRTDFGFCVWLKIDAPIQMVNEFGITHGDPRKTGYYVGLIVRSVLFHFVHQTESSFAGINIFRNRISHDSPVGTLF